MRNPGSLKLSAHAPISYWEAALSIFVLSTLTVFCQVAHFSLVIPLLLLYVGVHLYFFQKASIKLFLYLGLLLTLLLSGVYAMTDLLEVSPLYIPIAGIAMLAMLLFNDLQVTFLMSFISSVMVALILSDQPQHPHSLLSPLDYMVIYFIANLTSAYTVKDARTRGKFFSASLACSVMQVIVVILLVRSLDFIFSREFLYHYVRPIFINGFAASLVVMYTLRIFEFLFGVLTNFSLIELSDKDHPLLKRMSLEAPGTYHHSMVVSDIAEAASYAIGANALLTRVGAYYHDIGKMVKPEYFTENQLIGGNKHDHIEPSVSRLVILNHVKEGLELAKKYKLNPVIAQFIPQHHGTGIIYYFYQKALEGAQDKTSIDEDNYRYPGPKPQLRETAIVLLADSVEGAIRSLEDPTPKKIEETVRKIINNRFIDGQLDECNLTLKEIDRIASTFTRVLSAMYHSRVKYPEKKNGIENRNRKSAEKSSSQPTSDQDDHEEDSSQ
jgi:putative nucleotidyltransferase with HDIG domain